MSTPTGPSGISFFDDQTVRCPHPAHQVLRDEAPVWQDPMTGHWMITRYADIRTIALDTARFSNALPSGRDGSIRPVDPEGHPERAEVAQSSRRLRELFDEHGIGVRAPNLSLRDEPTHMQLRRLFDFGFRPKAITAIDGAVEDLAYELVDQFIDDGRCDVIGQYAVPLPLYIIGRQLGIDDAELPRIKGYTDAWIRRLGLMQDEVGMRRSVAAEAETRRYFEQHFARLRREPDDTLLSLLVNREIPEWGRPMTDLELHTEVMADLLVGGSETTTNALGAGVKILIQDPAVWRALKDDPQRLLEPFVEEVLRLESPVQVCSVRRWSTSNCTESASRKDRSCTCDLAPATTTGVISHAPTTSTWNVTTPVHIWHSAWASTTASVLRWPDASSTSDSRHSSIASTKCGSSMTKQPSSIARTTSCASSMS